MKSIKAGRSGDLCWEQEGHITGDKILKWPPPFLFPPVEAATERRNFPGYNSIWQIWLQPGPFPQKPTKDGPGESKPLQSLWLNSSIFFPLQRSQSLIFTNWYIPAPHMNLRKAHTLGQFSCSTGWVLIESTLKFTYKIIMGSHANEPIPILLRLHLHIHKQSGSSEINIDD